MDTTLVGVTLLSMAMAIALSIVVWRLLRDERRRSEARVAALADMMTRATPEARATPRASRTLDLPLHESRSSHPGSRIPDPGSRSSDLGSPVSLFSEPERASPWRGRAVIMGALALVATTVVLLTLTVRDRARAEHRSPASFDAAAAPAAVPPLELLSLRDSRNAKTLTITGLVQNPRGGVMLRQVTVTAFAFDASGAFLASGQALLDITALSPGDESPFVVAVPVTGNVARYRIGFRGENGQVIAHVDKRQRGAVADAAPIHVAGT